MTRGGWILALGLCAVAVYFGARLLTPEAVAAPAPDTVYIRLTAKSDTVIRTTLRTITKLDTLIDTLPGDTVFVPKEVLREVVRDCLACADQLRAHKAHCDSAQKAKDDIIARQARRIAQLEKQRPFYAAAGAGITLLACRGGD